MPITTNDVLTALRQEAVNAGLVRKPATVSALPPMFIEPEGGAPAPGEREGTENHATLMVTIELSSELAAPTFGAGTRTSIVAVHYRSKTTAGLQAARTLDDAIRSRVVGRPDYGLSWTMGAGAPAPLAAGLYVLQAGVFAGLGPVSRDLGQGVHEVAKYSIETLAG